MGRSPCCCHDAGVKKGAWTEEEDRTLVEHIQKRGGHVGRWRGLPKAAGLNRCGKSCRLRWTNYLRPDIKRGNFTDDEERLIIRLHSVVGNRWSTIATQLEGRTDNEIKNYWNTHIRKKLLRMRVDPVTHQQLPPQHHLNGASIVPEAFLSAAAGLGSLHSTLRQVQLLQQLLQAFGSHHGSAGLMANLAAANTTTLNSSTSIIPNFQEQMNMMSRASYQPGCLCDNSSSAEHDVLLEQLNAGAPGISYEQEPTDQLCNTAAAAFVSAPYPRDIAAVAATVDRPVQEFGSLEPMELPNLCSLESDTFWKNMLDNSYGL